MPPSQPPLYDFDIDRHLNPLIPHPRLHLLPNPISRLLGHRLPNNTQPPLGSLPVALYSFLGAFISISLISLVFHVLPIPIPTSSDTSFSKPIIIASFGASAILEYNSISSPLAQPRNLILGQLFSCLIGIGITKAFQASFAVSASTASDPYSGLESTGFESLRWLAGALAVSLSSAVMGLTKTVHPPAGATALLVATTPQVTELGWWLVVLVLLGSVVVLLVACLVNNIQRVWPLWWWTEYDLPVLKKGGDVEKGGGESVSGSVASAQMDGNGNGHGHAGARSGDGQAEEGGGRVIIRFMGVGRGEVEVVLEEADLRLSSEEQVLLKTLVARLQHGTSSRYLP